MSMDPVITAGLVTREVRRGTRDGAPTRTVVARRSYPTSQSDLWDALTSPDRIPRWFLPVSGDLEVGGRYQLEGNAGGVVERCEPPDSFAVTWEFGEMVSWLRISLAPAATGGATTLELVHEAPFDPGMWGEFGPGAVGVGWDLGLLGLGLYLDSGKPVDPEIMASFHTSPGGAGYIQRSAAGWADAAVGSGDDPEPAQEAAARTIAFYTTTPEDAGS
ncbi:polyketide cyclase [Parafrankia colletiae]|uniref:Polyketide cyclase n=1 Tax=Parafrankia colletiae TaxID=573497 RepID=A0A1S1R1N1_9ACTN|nr:SRPBCC domain-containing protein [Parafrankia colletiae]OHV38624.1 polyketide cyclase [Parafrankia colletiae]